MTFRFILLFICCFNFHGVCQIKNKPIIFPELGWSLILPNEFKIIDSSGINASIESGKKLVDTSSYKMLDPSERKFLIVAKKDGNSFFSTITPFDQDKDGSWKASTQLVKQVMYETFKTKFPPSITIDSSSGFVIIDSLDFDKFVIRGKENGEIVISCVILNKFYKQNIFTINYVTINDAIRKEIEEMLFRSKFTRD